MAINKQIEVSEPQHAILTSSKEYNLFLAGVGSGKSHLMGIISANYIINFPEATGLICANTYDQLSRSTLVQVFKVWHSYFGLVEDVHFVVDKQPPKGFKTNGEKLKTYRNVISFSNGARVFLASLDNYKTIDGLECSWSLLDETKDTKEEAVKEVIIARLRQNRMFIDKNGHLWDHKPPRKKVTGFNPLYIFTSPAKVQWLNEMFYVNDNLKEIKSKIFDPNDFYVGDFEDRRVVISSTYHNEHNLPDNYISGRRKVWDDTPGLTDMLIFASPAGKTGGEFYAKYQYDVHVKPKLEVNRDNPLHVSFDFNVNPYMPALVFQLEYEDDVVVIKVLREYALTHPRNTTGDVCDEIIFDYADVGSMYIYGDASGKNRVTALMSKNSPKDNYSVIKIKLRDYLFGDSMRVPRANPRLAGRRILANRIFSGNSKVRVEIDASCKNFINDLDTGKEGPNGEYVKEKAKDQNNKQYEKNGHHSDCFLYFCWYNFHKLTKIE